MEERLKTRKDVQEYAKSTRKLLKEIRRDIRFSNIETIEENKKPDTNKTER